MQDFTLDFYSPPQIPSQWTPSPHIPPPYTLGACSACSILVASALHLAPYLQILDLRLKGKGTVAIINGSIPRHSYGVSLAIWDHTVLPASRHK